ncbi:MAG: zinc ribbon domain-containing protein [Eubacteriales bacterium]|nr:zinc ribbon domain-containing protein [Eubacteriales bacterium]
MKITCPYCGSLFNDTLEHCPNCGAVNSGVVRKSGDQPVTIEELQKWYQDRGLPPAEVTRFFIGVDYKEPRAFGIYKDSQTGNFVVYKNKDTGQRAIRYEGSDEAYAVNELFQRLKQEIIEQKMNNVKKAQHSTSSNTSGGKKSSKQNLIIFIILFVVYILLKLMSSADHTSSNKGTTVLKESRTAPKEGYYNYENTVYYASREKYYVDGAVNSRHWFSYDENASDWSRFLTEEQVPEDLIEKTSAKEYYLSKKWDDSIGATNFLDSTSYEDLKKSFNVRTGYYKNGDTTLYHLTDFAYDNWYYYDTDTSNWTSIDASELPDDLLHTTSSDDFFYTATWDSSTQVTDFKDSGAYTLYKVEQRANTKDNSSSSNNSQSSRSSDYDWGSSDSWDSGSTDWSSDW